MPSPDILPACLVVLAAHLLTKKDKNWVDVLMRQPAPARLLAYASLVFVLATFGAWRIVEELFGDLVLPGFVKLAVFALVLGLVVLLVSVIREKIYTSRRDPYREVKR